MESKARSSFWKEDEGRRCAYGAVSGAVSGCWWWLLWILNKCGGMSGHKISVVLLVGACGGFCGFLNIWWHHWTFNTSGAISGCFWWLLWILNV